MERIEIHVPGVDEAYNATLLGSVPEYGLGTGKGLGHAVVTSGGRTLRMSGYPSISEEGVIGKGDMGLQTTIALDHVRKTVEMAGGTFNDIIHFTFFVTDHKQCWEKHLPTRIAYFKEHWTRTKPPCITTIGVSFLFHPDMMIEIEGIAALD